MCRSYLRIGVIPGGSTDALAYSLHGARDVVTAALHIVLGDDKVGELRMNSGNSN